ncbi:AMP-binding enzyme [Microbacterium sp. YJN-G]|uniref:AMP-binding enzyme n=1 Tax=Microbacterium sp. YJN-G TaxID=2763257 RepID=UPI0022272039|nr:hypothetical protein [Microbacterium sp. YJN-G]
MALAAECTLGWSPKNRRTTNPARLTLVLQGRLAKYKIPRDVIFVDDLPRTASGKVRKNELRQQYRGAPA